MKKLLTVLSTLLILSGCSGSAKEDAAGAEFYTTNGIADYSPAATEEAAYDEKDAERTDDEEQSSEKLVYTGSLEIETLDYDETVKNIRTWIDQYGVMIQNENAYDYDNSWRGYGNKGTRSLSMTLRVPSGRFYDFLNDMQGTGKVRSLSTNIENITRRYSTVSTEIESLEIQQERLLEMLRNAQNVEDMITIERRLSEVESDLKYYQNLRNDMDTDVEYSTVSLTVREVTEYTETNEDLYTGNFGKRFVSTLQWAGQFFVWLIQQVILTIIRLIPVAAVAAPLFWLLRKGWKWLKGRRQAKKEVKGDKIL